MQIAQCESGEVFKLVSTNPRIDAPVQLDSRLIEADQAATPWPVLYQRDVGATHAVDGIEFDEFGNPVFYFVLRNHPGNNTVPRAGVEFELLPVESVNTLIDENLLADRRRCDGPHPHNAVTGRPNPWPTF